MNSDAIALLMCVKGALDAGTPMISGDGLWEKDAALTTGPITGAKKQHPFLERARPAR